MAYKVFTNQGIAATIDVIIRASGRAFISWHLCKELGLNGYIGIETIHYLLEFDDETMKARVTFGPSEKFNDPNTKDWARPVKGEKKGISIDLKGLLVYLKIAEKKYQLIPEIHGGSENYLVVNLSSLIPGPVEGADDAASNESESAAGNGQESSQEQDGLSTIGGLIAQAADGSQETADSNDPGLEFPNVRDRNADGL